MSILAWLRRGPDRRFSPGQQGRQQDGLGPGDGHRARCRRRFGGRLHLQFLSRSTPTGINLCSIFVSLIRAVVVLLIYHAVVRRRDLSDLNPKRRSSLGQLGDARSGF